MISKTSILLILVLALIQALYAAECPSYSKVLNCTPKCLHDSECSAIGGKCCPNLCNGRSCADPNALDKNGGSNSPFSNKNTAGSGTYCGNVKCMAFQKCIMNSSTKRPECSRA